MKNPKKKKKITQRYRYRKVSDKIQHPFIIKMAFFFNRSGANTSKICMELQKILCSQNNFEKEEQSWRDHVP